MKTSYKYGDKEIFISPYKTINERDILLYLTVDSNPKLEGAIDILKEYIHSDISDFTVNEKLLLLYKLRDISLGNEIPMRFACKSCGAPNEQIIDINNIIEDDVEPDDRIIQCYKELTDENFQDFINTNIDELELDEYDALYEHVKNNIVNINLLQTRKCHKCKEDNIFDISDVKYTIENLSEDSLMSLYQTVNDMVFFSHYTKADIDNMIAFERSLYISLLNKTREDLAK